MDLLAEALALNRAPFWLALLALGACADRTPEGDLPADTAGPATTAAASAGLAEEDPPLELLSPEIRQACAAAADYWRSQPGATVRRFDSTATRPRSAALTDACWVRVRLDDDRGRDTDFRVPFAAAGWLPVYEFDADGKDGRSRVWQLNPVWCWVEERWDGGSDTDTSYVPAVWFEQSVACYRR